MLPCLPTMRTSDFGGVMSALLWQPRLSTSGMGAGQDYLGAQVFGRRTYRQLSNGPWDTTAPGGSTTQVQYNNAGAFGGVAGSGWNGTTLTLPLSSSPDSGSNSERFGAGSSATGVSATAFGNGAQATAQQATAFGEGAVASAIQSLAFGRSSSATSQGAMAFGTAATATADNSSAVGTSAAASGTNSFAFGNGSIASGLYGIAIGYLSSAAHQGSIAIGVAAASTATAQAVIGECNFGIGPFDLFIGGVNGSSPHEATYNAAGGSGTDAAGATISICGGKATGAAVGGSVKLKVSTAAASSATPQSLATGLELAPGLKIGFFGATAVVQPSAYTQTYSTADKTHANPTSATLTDSTTGSADTTVQDVGVLFSEATINDNFADVVAQINALRVDLLDLKQLVNSVIDDLQALGLAQ